MAPKLFAILFVSVGVLCYFAAQSVHGLSQPVASDRVSSHKEEVGDPETSRKTTLGDDKVLALGSSYTPHAPSTGKPPPPLEEFGFDEYDISEFGNLGTVVQYLLREDAELQTDKALKDAFDYTTIAFNDVASRFDIRFNPVRQAWITVGQSHIMYGPEDELLVFSKPSNEYDSHVDIVVLKHGGWVSRVTISDADYNSKYSDWSQHSQAD